MMEPISYSEFDFDLNGPEIGIGSVFLFFNDLRIPGCSKSCIFGNICGEDVISSIFYIDHVATGERNLTTTITAGYSLNICAECTSMNGDLFQSMSTIR